MLSRNYTLSEMPILVKSGSIIPMRTDNIGMHCHYTLICCFIITAFRIDMLFYHYCFQNRWGQLKRYQRLLNLQCLLEIHKCMYSIVLTKSSLICQKLCNVQRGD